MTTSVTRLLPPSGRAAVMGILNITPDSFSDGGRFWHGRELDADRVLAQAEAMVASGVDLFDVGGESTRPGADPVTVEEELDRVVPVVRLLKSRFDVPVSVDTSSPQVIAAVAAEGADLVNDVRALTRPGALEAAAQSGMAVCVMHMPAEPGVMQVSPHYNDVVAEVRAYLDERVAACLEAGIPRQSIAIDPGFGFGKTLTHNLELFRHLPDFVAAGLPVLVGVSRKRMVGEMLGREVDERLYGSLALAMLAAQSGAKIIRVHDVAATVDVIRTLTILEQGK